LTFRLIARSAKARLTRIEEEKMKKSLLALLTLLLAVSFAAAAQNGNSNSNSNSSAKSTNSNRKRGPVFRANKDQIMQAQAILKQRGFYSGEQTGKLDPDTRAGLKKYQEAEKIKVTGTLNRITLEKMNIPLTDKQKAI
jgi:peptidoglycan hydrolase-like protein with peptidoglycan-binding domain